MAEAEAVDFKTAYDEAQAARVNLQSTLDRLERNITAMSSEQRTAVRKVERPGAGSKHAPLTRFPDGDLDELAFFAEGGDPHDIGVRAAVLLSSVLDAHRPKRWSTTSGPANRHLQRAADVADSLVETRIDWRVHAQWWRLVGPNVEAQFNLKVFAAGSEYRDPRGFVFPVGRAAQLRRQLRRTADDGYELRTRSPGYHIMAPMGTPLLACERDIITKMGSGVLGGTTLWVKGESGTYYYYATCPPSRRV